MKNIPLFQNKHLLWRW